MISVSHSQFFPKVGDRVETIDTPAVVVDLDLVDANVSKLFALFKAKKKAVRPHLKTVKCPEFAQMFLSAGAIGVCVAKVSEAEVLAAAGIEDILITTEIAGDLKIKRFINLLRNHPKVKIVVDNIEAAKALDAEAQSARVKPSVLIELNVGQNRCGVEPGDPALRLAQSIGKLDSLELVGVQGYEGHLQHVHDRKERERLCREAINKLVDTVKLLEQNGISIKIVTTGGTGTSEFCSEFAAVTEVQPGSFAFMDVDYRNAIGTSYANALTIVSTVISKPAPNRVVIDAGLKSLSTDSGNAEVQGMKGIAYTPGGDEHGILQIDSASIPLKIGDRVHMIPSHIDTTINLHDFYICHRKGILERIWNISARGKVQ
jgi:D-serine deaminase-like pyridoxal phosphate-dependent protein